MSPVIWTVEIRESVAESLARTEALRPIAITRAPMASATFTAKPPKAPVAGAMTMVSPA